MVWPFDHEGTEQAHTAYDVLHRKVNSGLGVSGLSTAAGAHRDRIQQKFAEAEHALHDALASAGAVWVGQASDSAQAGIRPMAGFSADAAAASDSMAAAVENEADQFTRARNAMPEPVQVSATDSALERGAANLFGNQTDLEQQEAARAAAEAEGYRIYDDYSAQSGANRAGVGSYPAAPQTALGTAEQGATQAQVAGSGDPAGTVTQGGGTGAGGTAVSQPGASSAPAAGGGAGGAAAGGGTGAAAAPAPAAARLPATGPSPGTSAAPDAGGGAAATRAPGSAAGAAGGGGLPRGGGLGGVVPAPVPFGGGTAGGTGANRWRRTVGPGLFDNNPRGTRGGGSSGLGRGGGGSGAGAAGAAGAAGSERGAAGRVAASGAAAEGARTGTAAAGARGAGGAPAGAMAGAGGARREEDTEHKTPDYLIETVDVYGDERTVAPAVFGEDDRRA